MFAVIKTGGKQYLVKEGQILKVEKLTQEEGDDISFDAMLTASEDGSDVKVGKPVVSGAKVSAVVVENGRDKKISVIKYKAKSNYRKNVGHRQPFTKIKIEKIEA
ncbi:50S ribosomal protein L21 [Patescibacteria group bacterium]|nr:50S ribosomal protein L21 [Patescibacteria group bacterium]